MCGDVLETNKVMFWPTRASSGLVKPWIEPGTGRPWITQAVVPGRLFSAITAGDSIPSGPKNEAWLAPAGDVSTLWPWARWGRAEPITGLESEIPTVTSETTTKTMTSGRIKPRSVRRRCPRRDVLADAGEESAGDRSFTKPMIRRRWGRSRV